LYNFGAPVTGDVDLVANWNPEAKTYNITTRYENFQDTEYSPIKTITYTGDVATLIDIESELT